MAAGGEIVLPRVRGDAGGEVEGAGGAREGGNGGAAAHGGFRPEGVGVSERE